MTTEPGITGRSGQPAEATGRQLPDPAAALTAAFETLAQQPRHTALWTPDMVVALAEEMRNSGGAT